MRTILLLLYLVVSFSAICQTQPRSKNVKTASEFNKNKFLTTPQIPSNGSTNKRVKVIKMYAKKLTVSKPTDHLLDLKNEPD